MKIFYDPYDSESEAGFENEELKELEIMKVFKKHNIIKERVDLYKDFTINLLYYINETYLGKEYLKTKKDIEGHFNWCFGKVSDEFFEEEISFYENTELYEYFFNYYFYQFYNLKYTEPNIKDHLKNWNSIFSFDRIQKNRKNIELLTEVYKIFDKSINQNISTISIN